MSEQTKEPWIYELPNVNFEGLIMGRHGGVVFDGDFTEANARRIVACVNACAGVPTEWLENEKSPVFLGAPIGDRFRELEQQRDELVEALSAYPTHGEYFLEHLDATCLRNNALAKVGSGTTVPKT